MGNVSQQKPDDTGNFIKGAIKGMVTSALFMGLFYGMLGVAGIIIGEAIINFAAPTTLLTIGGAFIASTLFNGIISVLNGREQSKNTDQASQGRGREQETITPVMLPTMAPTVAADRAQETESAPEREWAQNVGTRSNNIEQILQNGSMSDKDRAAAILAEREARIGQSQTL
ncbi:MAG: hypothetical protein J0M34_09330 [Alphaproteobacteria bacterium]|nr:hypothetical protein [Alphaproteobacteria bacterium]